MTHLCIFIYMVMNTVRKWFADIFNNFSDLQEKNDNFYTI